MDVKELSEMLEQLRRLHVSEGANTQAKDFQRILDILEGHEDESVAEYVEKTRQLLAAPVTKKKQIVLDEVNIKKYVERLKSAGTDRGAFEAVYDDLDNNRLMRKQEVIEIAHGYTGYEMTYKTKKKALDEIRAKFTEIARHDARMSIIDKVTPW